MSSEQVEKLFQPTKNKSTIGTSSEKGSGLGLILVKELVELNKGKIQVDSFPRKEKWLYEKAMTLCE